MKTGSLFSGAGMLSAAVDEVFNSSTVWHSEIETAPCKVLSHQYTGVPNLGDITKIDWHSVEPVDIMDGGSPCQDLSVTGKRRGMSTGTRSGLWESMREGIAVLRPQYVVWENVKGALSASANSELERVEGRVGGLRALGRVLGDLASLGYDASWGVFRASDAGAPHRRERVFVLAANSYRESHGPGSHPEWVARTSVQAEGPLSPTITLPRAGAAYTPEQARADLTVEEFGPYTEVVRRWAQVVGPPPSSALLTDDHLNPRFAEWMMGLPTGWVTDPAIGLTRAEQLKIIGNGVVPQQAALALRTLRARLEEV